MTSPDSATHKAIWVPSWYELDQPLRLNEVGRFVFYGCTPDWLHESQPSIHGDFDFVFFNQLLGDTPRDARTARVVGIHHPTLGQLQSVDTYGLDYTFQHTEGQQWIVNAEETPGICHQQEVDVTDWSLTVWLADVSDSLPRQHTDPGQGI